MADRKLVVVGPEGPRPFMRGILVQSLVSRGVPFDAALATATKVRERIARRGSVEQDELKQLVEELLGENPPLEPLPRVQEPPRVRGPGGSSTPLSKGILAVSLQGSGLDPSDAYDVARTLETRLIREGRREISRDDLRELVSEAIEQAHGLRAAERYRVLRQALQAGRPIFVLLGGSSGVGKTSIAVEVARRLEISRVIGTDSIRQIMRLMFSPDLMPEIHCSTYTAHRVLNLDRARAGDPVIAGFREQAQKIAVGVHALLDRALEENTSMVLEGVNLLPDLLELERYEQSAHVMFAVAATLDLDAYRGRFGARATREQERKPERYLDHLDDIMGIQDYVLGEADQHGLPIIDNVHVEEAVAAVLRCVIATLEKAGKRGQGPAKAGDWSGE
jgi:2-phosphoglycerate kinase